MNQNQYLGMENLILNKQKSQALSVYISECTESEHVHVIFKHFPEDDMFIYQVQLCDHLPPPYVV